MVIIGVIGQPENETHTSIARSLEHTGVSTAVRWIRTTEVDNTDLSSFDAIWCAPGTPYTSMEGALAGIRFAREYGMPFLGTCAGFQHAILEFGRNVLDIRDAASEEYTIAGAPLFISRLSCSLIGNLMPVRLEAGSRARDAYGSDHAVERYYCNFGLNSRWEPQLTSAGLLIKGRDSDGDARIIELRSHPFFVATLFVAQTSSAINSPHPLIRTFAVTAEERAAT